jgi:hypothetical protein
MYRAMGANGYRAFFDSTSDFPEYLLRTADRSTETLTRANTPEAYAEILNRQASLPAGLQLTSIQGPADHSERARPACPGNPAATD